jgi:hypothetical protein
MLGIDQDPIKAGASDYLGRHVAAQAGPETDLWPGFAERPLEGVGGHLSDHGRNIQSPIGSGKNNSL